MSADGDYCRFVEHEANQLFGVAATSQAADVLRELVYEDSDAMTDLLVRVAEARHPKDETVRARLDEANHDRIRTLYGG